MVRKSEDNTGLILKSMAILLLYVDTTSSGKSKKHHHTAAPAIDSAKLNDMMAGGGYPGDNLPPSAGGYGSPDGLPPNYPDMPPQPPKANMNDLLAGLMTTTSINFGDLGGAGLGDLPAGLEETTLDLNANIALLNQMNLATDPPTTAAPAPTVQAIPNLVNIPFMPNYFVDPNLLAAYQNPFGIFNPVLPNPYMVPNLPPNIPINFLLGNANGPNYPNNNNYGPSNQNGYNPGQNSANNFNNNNNNNNNFGQNGPNCFNNNNNAPCNSNTNGNDNANFNSNSNGNNQNRNSFGSSFNNYGNCGQNNFGGSNNNPSNNQNGINYNPQSNNNNFQRNNQNMNSIGSNNNLNGGNFIQNNQNGIASSNNGLNIQNNQNNNNQGSNNQMVNNNDQNMNFDNNNNNNLNNLNQDMVTNLDQNTNNNGNNIPSYSNQNGNNPQINNYGSNNNFVPINSNNYNQNSKNNNENNNLNPYNNNPNNNNNNGLQNSNNPQNNNFPGDNSFFNNNPNKMGNVDNNSPNRDNFQANNQMLNENGPDFKNGNGISDGAVTKAVPNNANYPDANIQSGNRNGNNNPGDMADINNNPNFKNYPDYGAKFSNNFQSADTFQQTEQTVSNTNFFPNYDTNLYNRPKDPFPDGLQSNLTYNGQGDNVDPYNPANNQINQNIDIPTGNPNKVMYPDYHQNMGDANKLNQYPQNDVPPTNMDYGNFYSKNSSFGPMYGDNSPQPLNVKESNIPKNYMMSEEAVSVTPDLKTYDSVDGWKKETTANKDSSQSKERKHLKGKRHKKKRKKMLDDLFGGDDSQHTKPKSESNIAKKSSFEDPYKSNDEVKPKKDYLSKEFKSASQFDDLSKDQLMKDKNKIDALLKDKYSDNSGTDISTTSKPSLWNKLANGGSWLLNGVPRLKNVLVNDFKYYITDLDS